MTYKLPYEIPNPVPVNEVIIEHKSFKAFYKKRLLSKKRRFEYHCIRCSTVSISSRGNQMSRQFPWICDSCARESYWAQFTRKERQEKQQKTIKHNQSKEIREARSKQMTKEWADPTSYYNTEWVPPMNNLETRKKMSKLMKNKLLNDEDFRVEFLERMKNSSRGTLIKSTDSYGSPITLRSTYELRMATWLNENEYEWLYESKSFYLESLDKTYTPDFYLPKLDVWIEVKGFWQNQSEAKWVEFCKSYNNALLFKCDIEKLENGESLENKINYVQ
jgi:hypothetical protein